MRYLTGSFWTPQRDKQLRKLNATGLSARQIGAQFGISRNAVIARLARLRGVIFPSEARREKLLRAEAAARRRERKRVNDAAISVMRRAIAQGVHRNIAIADAVKAGASYRAVGEEFDLSRQRVHQILTHTTTRPRGRPPKVAM